MLFVAILALCHSVLATEPDANYSAIGHSPLSTITHDGTVYVLAGRPTVSLSDELEIEKRRDTPVAGIDDQVEATIVIATVPAALSTVLSPQSSGTNVTVINGVTISATPGPSGVYSTGTGTDSGDGPGSGGEASLPAGAYGQPHSTIGQQAPSLTGEQSSYYTGQQAPNPTGQQSPSPTERLTFNPVPPAPSVLVTVVPLLGTVVETITINLESESGNSPVSTYYTSGSSSTGFWGPLSSLNTQPLQTTFVTIQTSEPLSTSCESNTASWGLLSTSNTQIVTTFVTVPGTGAPAPISANPNAVTTEVITVPGSPVSLLSSAPTENPADTSTSGWTTTSSAPVWETASLIPGWETTPNVPGWATVSVNTVTASDWVTTSGSIATASNSLQTDPDTTVPALSSSTCTTDIFTNVISTSVTPSTITAAATLAAGSSVGSQKTSWSFQTFATADSTVTPVPVNAAVTTTDFNISVICGAITFALLISLTLY